MKKRFQTAVLAAGRCSELDWSNCRPVPTSRPTSVWTSGRTPIPPCAISSPTRAPSPEPLRPRGIYDCGLCL